jgi:hypothetical protein
MLDYSRGAIEKSSMLIATRLIKTIQVILKIFFGFIKFDANILLNGSRFFKKTKEHNYF